MIEVNAATAFLLMVSPLALYLAYAGARNLLKNTTNLHVRRWRMQRDMVRTINGYIRHVFRHCEPVPLRVEEVEKMEMARQGVYGKKAKQRYNYYMRLDIVRRRLYAPDPPPRIPNEIVVPVSWARGAYEGIQLLREERRERERAARVELERPPPPPAPPPVRDPPTAQSAMPRGGSSVRPTEDPAVRQVRETLQAIQGSGRTLGRVQVFLEDGTLLIDTQAEDPTNPPQPVSRRDRPRDVR